VFPHDLPILSGDRRGGVVKKEKYPLHQSRKGGIKERKQIIALLKSSPSPPFVFPPQKNRRGQIPSSVKRKKEKKRCLSIPRAEKKRGEREKKSWYTPFSWGGGGAGAEYTLPVLCFGEKRKKEKKEGKKERDRYVIQFPPPCTNKKGKNRKKKKKKKGCAAAGSFPPEEKEKKKKA